jgi:serine protease Do
MSDFYEFNERKHSRRMTVGNMIVVGLICLLIGAVGMYFILPIFGIDDQNQDESPNDETPAITAEATPTPSPEPSETPAQTPILGARGDLFISGENPVVEIAEKVGPAVVGITNKAQVSVPGFWGETITQDVEATGSGIILSEDGYIVTNYHVVEGYEELVVVMSDGAEIPAEYIGGDSINDVAVIKIDPEGIDLTVAKIGDSDNVKVGELAVAIGNPLGHELYGSVTVGIVSGLNRTITVDNRELTLIQTDAAINPGNSGGALVNAQGEVIGMNTLKEASSRVEGLGFAIPSNLVVAQAQKIIQQGDIKWPGLGVRVQEISEEIVEQYGVPRGVHVIEVTPGGAAEKAGIQPNDIIVAFDGAETPTYADLAKQISKHEVGDTVKVQLWRKGDELTVDVTLMALSN